MAIIATFLVTFSYQQTPLHVAASKSRDYTVEWLVKKGADINIKDKTGVHETILLIIDSRVSLYYLWVNDCLVATTDLKLSA